MSRLDTCPVDSLPRYGDLSKIFGMVWRFLPLLDPRVDVMVSRDLDSRLGSREVAAVTQWLEQDTSLPFHVMRDHPQVHYVSRVTCHVSSLHLQHYTEILGGMWGARLDTGHRELLREAMDKLITSVRKQEYFRAAFIIT